MRINFLKIIHHENNFIIKLYLIFVNKRVLKPPNQTKTNYKILV